MKRIVDKFRTSFVTGIDALPAAFDHSSWIPARNRLSRTPFGWLVSTSRYRQALKMPLLTFFQFQKKLYYQRLTAIIRSAFSSLIATRFHYLPFNSSAHPLRLYHQWARAKFFWDVWLRCLCWTWRTNQKSLMILEHGLDRLNFASTSVLDRVSVRFTLFLRDVHSFSSDSIRKTDKQRNARR